MPVEFLSDDQAAAYEGFVGVPSPKELERYFFLDDEDLVLVRKRREERHRLGFALQLVTVRYLGKFLEDPLAVPWAIVGYLAEQLEIADASCVKTYTERRQTHFEHAWEIKEAFGLRDFQTVQQGLEAWVDAQAWSSSDGPVALFDGAVRWLRQEKVLLPGVSTLARLVARVREEAMQRLWGTLYDLVSPAQAQLLARLTEVADGERTSVLERLRTGPTSPTGKAMAAALARVGEIDDLGFGALDLSAVPHGKVIALARYGMTAKVSVLRRHLVARQVATLLATVAHLGGQAVDDALELLDLLMVAHVAGPAKRAADRENLKQYPRLSRSSAALAAAVEVLLEATEPGTETSLLEVWEQIEARVPLHQLRAALASVNEIVPPLGTDPDIGVRDGLVAKVATVRPFLALLCQRIDFRATAQAEPVLAAMKDAGRLLGTQGPLSVKAVDVSLVTGSWKRLVFDKPGLKAGTVDKRAYAMCVLEQFHRLLRQREIYAPSSARWGDPRAQLLTGRRWELAKPAVLTALRLPEGPTELLAGHAAALDAHYREVAGRFEANAAVDVDVKGRLHVQALEAVPEPASLVDLRRRVAAMLPQVDVGELILEVMGWNPAMVEAFTSVTGGEARMADLPVVIAAALTAHSLNIGYTPIVKTGAISRARISHVDQNYLRAETYSPANVPLIEAQAGIGLAQAWGGGLVAAVDGMRFVVPVKSIYARPSSKYFGRDRGATWLNLVNDQAAGLAGMVVPGTPRDSLHVLDLIYRQEGGAEPEILVSDMSSATDVIFGLVHLLGKQYRPAPADLPDERLWRADPHADYGPLNVAARGRLDLDRCARHWPDMLRVVASVHTGEVLASQVMRVLQRDGTLTPLGDAFAHYGRIFKSRHLLSYIDDPDYRRDIKGIRNLQEGRHSLAKHLCHGKQGQLHQRYQQGMEEQLGALGLVLNCVTLWNTVYMDAALAQLSARGYPVADDDVARLSPFPRSHINVHGTYTFALPDLPGGLRSLRDPDAAQEED